MREYLLNPNLLIISSIALTGTAILYYRKVVRALAFKRLLFTIGLGILLFGIELYVLSSTFGLQDTPAGAYYIALACNLLLTTMVLSFRQRHALLYGGLAFLSGLLLLALTINNYYQYYPTVQSIFFESKRFSNATALTTTHLRDQYAALTIEKSLYGSGLSHGTIQTKIIPGTASHLETRDAYIYLPPAYSDAAFASIKFPVLVLLTGTPGTPVSWLQGGQFTTIMDQFASHHNGITPIVVIADHSGSFSNDTECVDSPHGNADTYLTTDVPSFIRQQYRVSSDPLNWGIGGFSEGGMCAAMLTLKHQNVYRHFLDLGGDPFPYLNDTKQTLPVLFGGSKQAQKTSNIDWLLANQPISAGLTAQFSIGANDNRRLVTELQQTYRLASQRKIPSSIEIVAHQGHNFTAWISGYSNALPRLSYYLGATECETSCSQ